MPRTGGGLSMGLMEKLVALQSDIASLRARYDESLNELHEAQKANAGLREALNEAWKIIMSHTGSAK
jgi:hypothetical protein